MNARRIGVNIGLVALFAMIGFLAYASWSVKWQARKALFASNVVRNELENQLTGGLANMPLQPGIARKASLRGTTTTLTLTFTNPNATVLSNVIVDNIRLGLVVPTEAANLPVQLEAMEPFTTKEVVLHFEGVPWKLMGDGAHGSGFTTLDLHQEWTVLPARVRTLATNNTATFSPARATSDYSGLSVELDNQSVRNLMQQKKVSRGLEAQETNVP